MALLRPKLLFNVVKRSLSSTKTLSAHWNKDFQPGPYPKTEEEMAAAAKKYGLMREEYQPIPDDGDGAGDYPDFKPYSVEGRDIFYPWDIPEYRRNFKEPLHEDFNIYCQDKCHVEMKPRFSGPTILASFVSVMGGFFLLFYALEDTAFLPAMPKHLPAQGTHYKYPEN